MKVQRIVNQLLRYNEQQLILEICCQEIKEMSRFIQRVRAPMRKRVKVCVEADWGHIERTLCCKGNILLTKTSRNSETCSF